MEVFTVSGGEGPFAVEIAVAICGEDLNLAVCGGTRHHVGASALAVPRPSLRDPQELSASESVLCVVGHKDDVVAKSAAHSLAKEFGCVVSVSAGLHLDDAGRAEIDGLMAAYNQALAEVAASLRKRGFGRRA